MNLGFFVFQLAQQMRPHTDRGRYKRGFESVRGGGDGCDDFAFAFRLSFERIESGYQISKAKQEKDSVSQDVDFNGSVVPLMGQHCAITNGTFIP
jgi:hypothetical protein